MNKRNTELFGKIETVVGGFEFEGQEKLLGAIKQLMETTRATAEVENPNKIIDGVEYKWCNRHHQYENMELANFRVKKDGSLWPTCQIAYDQRVVWDKAINKLRKSMNNVIAGLEEGDIAKLAVEINESEISRKAVDVAYDNKDTLAYALIDDNRDKEGAQKPTRKGKK